MNLEYKKKYLKYKKKYKQLKSLHGGRSIYSRKPKPEFIASVNNCNIMFNSEPTFKYNDKKQRYNFFKSPELLKMQEEKVSSFNRYIKKATDTIYHTAKKKKDKFEKCKQFLIEKFNEEIDKIKERIEKLKSIVLGSYLGSNLVNELPKNSIRKYFDSYLDEFFYSKIESMNDPKSTVKVSTEELYEVLDIEIAKYTELSKKGKLLYKNIIEKTAGIYKKRTKFLLFKKPRDEKSQLPKFKAEYVWVAEVFGFDFIVDESQQTKYDFSLITKGIVQMYFKWDEVYKRIYNTYYGTYRVISLYDYDSYEYNVSSEPNDIPKFKIIEKSEEWFKNPTLTVNDTKLSFNEYKDKDISFFIEKTDPSNLNSQLGFGKTRKFYEDIKTNNFTEDRNWWWKLKYLCSQKDLDKVIEKVKKTTGYLALNNNPDREFDSLEQIITKIKKYGFSSNEDYEMIYKKLLFREPLKCNNFL